jgi:S1-C subfamily serine protease
VGPLERDFGTTLTVVDTEGQFTVEGLAPDTYTLRAAAHGRAPAAMRVNVPPNVQDVGPVEVTLGPGVKLEGQVVRTGGAPVEGARVTVEGGAYGASLDTLYDGLTDASGRFSVEGLAPGAVSLSVSARGHHSRIVNGVRVGPGAPPVPPVELEPVAEGETEKVEMVGIGAVLGPREDALVLGQIFPGGGAHEAGLKPGDAIVRIEGTPVVDIGFAEAVPRIRGPEGSQLKLGIRRAGASEVVDVVVTRRKVKI